MGLLLTFSPFAFGFTGIQLFLLISGFLIHLGYLKKGAELDVPHYINRRFWRIYPAYLLVLLFFAFAIKEPVNAWDIVSHLLFIHTWDNDTFFTINPSLWSLGLEFQLYMLYPALLYIRKKVGINKAVLLLAVLAFAFSFEGMEYLTISVSPMRMWVVWGMGAWLAERYVSGKGLPRLNWWQLTVFLLLIVFSRYFKLYWHIAHHAFAFFYLVAIGTYLSMPEQKLNRFIKPFYKLVVWFGVISYSVYLIHQPFLPQLLAYFGDRELYGFSSPSLIAYVVRKIGAMGIVLLLITAVSYTLYYFVELKSVKWGRAFYDRYVKPYREKPDLEKRTANT